MSNHNGNSLAGETREFMVWLSNLDELGLVYGAGLRQQVLDQAIHRLETQGLLVRQMEHKDSTLIATGELPPEPGDCLERICAAVGREPVAVGRAQVWLQVEAQEVSGISTRSMSEMHGRSRSASSRQQLPRARNLRARWKQDYQDDMALACRLLGDLRPGHLALAFQPVAALAASGLPPLYYECLLRRSVASGDDGYDLPQAIQALERLGLVERLDRSVLWAALDALAANEDLCLGCNVSARSFVNSAWWSELLEHLEDHPAVAQRLVLEIAEIPEGKSAQGLIRHLQILGVRMALAGIRTHSGSLDALGKARINIVKLDQSVLETSSAGKLPLKMLESLVSMCAERGATVIVQGIDSEAKLEAAREAGAEGAQGYFIARPSLHLHGLFEHVVQVPDILRLDETDTDAWAESALSGWSRVARPMPAGLGLGLVQ